MTSTTATSDDGRAAAMAVAAKVELTVVAVMTKAVKKAVLVAAMVFIRVSLSTSVSVPTPAVPRYIATGEPSPPAPITSTCAAISRCWPSMPISSSRMWRE